MNLGTGRQTLDRNLDVVRDVSGLDGQLHGVVLDRDDRLDGGGSHEVDGHVNVDLLALTNDDEVNVLDDRPDRVALDVLGQGQVVLAVDLDGEQDVGDLEGQHRLVARQADMNRVGAVAVHDGGDVVFAADGAGGTLAERGARYGDKLVPGSLGLGHGALQCCRSARR